MSHLSNNTSDAVDGLLDHAIAQARALKVAQDHGWYAVQILVEVDRIFRLYGRPAAPHDELAPLLEMVRHCLLTAPEHAAPEAPGVGAVFGEAPAPSLGPGVDIDVEVDHFPLLEVTDRYDGDAA